MSMSRRFPLPRTREAYGADHVYALRLWHAFAHGLETRTPDVTKTADARCVGLNICALAVVYAVGPKTRQLMLKTRRSSFMSIKLSSVAIIGLPAGSQIFTAPALYCASSFSVRSEFAITNKGLHLTTSAALVAPSWVCAALRRTPSHTTEGVIAGRALICCWTTLCMRPCTNTRLR